MASHALTPSSTGQACFRPLQCTGVHGMPPGPFLEGQEEWKAPGRRSSRFPAMQPYTNLSQSKLQAEASPPPRRITGHTEAFLSLFFLPSLLDGMLQRKHGRQKEKAHGTDNVIEVFSPSPLPAWPHTTVSAWHMKACSKRKSHA